MSLALSTTFHTSFAQAIERPLERASHSRDLAC
jgi:hypothetical protein